jgi:GntR family transcriptional regulator
VKRAEVRDRLRELAEARQSGVMMPSERLLSAQLGVARGTVRAAMADLVEAGLLVRREGRGSFTSTPTGRQVPAHEPAPVVAAMPVPPAHLDWRSTVVQFRTAAAGARLGSRMRLSPSDLLLHVQRIRIVDDAPMAVEDIRLPAALVPGITRADFESGSLYRLMAQRYALVAEDAVQTTEPTVTDEDEAHLLQVPLYAPALLFERITRTGAGQIIEYTRSIYRGDRYKITNHLRFDHNSG